MLYIQFLRILRVWKKFFYDSNYQLSAEIIQMKPSTSGPVSKELSGLNNRLKQKMSWTPKAEGKQKSLRRRENSEEKCV